MTRYFLATTAIVALLGAGPVVAQQQQQQAGQNTGQAGQMAAQPAQAGQSSQRLTQEVAQYQGTELYVGPAGVRQVEQALNQAGYDAGDVDGKWDDQSRRAARKFQQAQGLEPTGSLTVSTVMALGLDQVLGGQQASQGQPGQSDQRLAQEQTGSKGEQLYASPAAVRVIQQALNQAGYDPGDLNGQWTEETRNSATNFQQAQGLEPTGVLDVSLIQALGVGNRIFAQGGSSSQRLMQQSAGGSQQQGGQQQASAQQQAQPQSGQKKHQQAEKQQQAQKESGEQQSQQHAAQQAGETGQQVAQQTGEQAAQQTGQQGQSQQGQSQQGQSQQAQADSGSEGTPIYLGPAGVRTLTQALNQAGYDAGAVEGKWDQDISQAVKNFQQAQGLEPTGTLTTQTLAALGMQQWLPSQLMQGGGQQIASGGGAIGGQPAGGQQPAAGGGMGANTGIGGDAGIGANAGIGGNAGAGGAGVSAGLGGNQAGVSAVGAGLAAGAGAGAAAGAGNQRLASVCAVAMNDTGFGGNANVGAGGANAGVGVGGVNAGAGGGNSGVAAGGTAGAGAGGGVATQTVPVNQVRGMRVLGATGDKVGKVERIVTANSQNYIVLESGGFLGIGGKEVALPLSSATMCGDQLVLPQYTEDQIDRMRSVDVNGLQEIQPDQNIRIQAWAG